MDGLKVQKFNPVPVKKQKGQVDKKSNVLKETFLDALEKALPALIAMTAAFAMMMAMLTY